MRRLLCALIACTAGGCSNVDIATLRTQEAVLNGNDDRKEVFELDEVTRQAIASSSAALVYSNHVSWGGPNGGSLNAESAAVALGLCSDEPFASEPCAAFCSAVLIDDDLVLTAGHCLGGDLASAMQLCQRVQVVFGYGLEAADSQPQLDADQVFSCRRVVTLSTAPADFAVLQLDRPVSAPLAPARFAAAAVQPGDALLVASYGAGLPLKVELAALVTSASLTDGSFVLASDTFSGSSGGGLFTKAFELAGLFEGGEPDWIRTDGCSRAQHSATPAERGQPASAIPAAVCASGWQSNRLCGVQPDCGRGVCGATCPQNCATPRCGDLLCQPSERQTCGPDCSRYDDVPSSWLDDPAAYPGHKETGISNPVGPSASGGCAVSGRLPPGLAWWSIGLAVPVLRRRHSRRRRIWASARRPSPSPASPR